MNVYYFSRTLKSKDIATQISDKFNYPLHVIDDGKDWSGKLNYIKAGAMAAKKEVLEVTYTKTDSDTVFLVFPIWAGSMPPAVRGFVLENTNKNIIAITVSAISSLNDNDKKYFKYIYEVKGKDTLMPVIKE